MNISDAQVKSVFTAAREDVDNSVISIPEEEKNDREKRDKAMFASLDKQEAVSSDLPRPALADSAAELASSASGGGKKRKSRKARRGKKSKKVKKSKNVRKGRKGRKGKRTRRH